MSKAKRSNALSINVWTIDGEDIPEEIAKEITTLVDKIVKDNRLVQSVVRA